MWYPQRSLREQLSVIAALRLPERAQVLEAGCGTGPLLRLLASEFPEWRLTGIDLCCGSLSEGCMLAAEQKSGIDFLQVDLYRLPYADGTFDLVYTRDVLGHLERREEALAELRRVVKPGGKLILFEGIKEHVEAPSAK